MRPLALLAVLALASLPFPGVASARAVSVTEHYKPDDFLFSWDHPCTGEPLLFEGGAHFLVHQTIDATGGDHGVELLALHGVTAIGPSGTTYHLQLVSAIPFNDPRSESPREPGLEGTNVQRLRVVAEGAAGDVLVNLLAHFTVNANGELTATVVQEEVKVCGEQ